MKKVLLSLDFFSCFSTVFTVVFTNYPRAFVFPMLAGLCSRTIGIVARLCGGETTLDILVVRHQRWWLHNEGRNDWYCDCHLRTDGAPTGRVSRGGENQMQSRTYIPGKCVFSYLRTDFPQAIKQMSIELNFSKQQ